MAKEIALSVASASLGGIITLAIMWAMRARAELHAYSDGYRDSYRKYGHQRCPDVSAHERIMDQEIMCREAEARWVPIQSHHGDTLSPMHEHEAVTDKPPEATPAELRAFIRQYTIAV